MKTKNIYIILSIILVLLVSGLIGWSIFIGKQQQSLNKQKDTIGYGDTKNIGIFGNAIKTITQRVTDTLHKKKESSQQFEPQFVQVYSLPTAGYTQMGTSTIRFVERSTGDVFEYTIPTKKTDRVEQVTIPSTYKAQLVDNNDAVLRQTLDEKNNILTSYSKIGDTSEVFLPINAYPIVYNKDENKLAFVQKTDNGSYVVISNTNGTSNKVLFSSHLKNWLLSFAGTHIILTQAPSNTTVSTAYVINSNTGTNEVVLKQKTGLETKISPDGKKVLFDTIQNNKPVLAVLDLSTHTTQKLLLNSFVDKCVWTHDSAKIYCAVPNTFPKGEYPDSWKQGVIHFSDSLWKINLEKSLLEKVAPLTSTQRNALDMTNLQIDDTETTLLFTDNFNKSLWMIILSKPEKQTATTTANTVQ